MTNKDNGGPAFPCDYEGSTRSDACGLSIRDYFAAKFMCGRAAVHGFVDPGTDAEMAYRAADAMLLERAIESTNLGIKVK